MASAAALTALMAAGAAGAVEVDFAYTGARQSFIVPFTGAYTITSAGGAGGNTLAAQGGLGAYFVATFDLTAGDSLTLIVGGQGGRGNASGTSGPLYRGEVFHYGAGGGGATWVFDNGYDLLMVAGGGGGAGTVWPSENPFNVKVGPDFSTPGAGWSAAPGANLVLQGGGLVPPPLGDPGTGAGGLAGAPYQFTTYRSGGGGGGAGLYGGGQPGELGSGQGGGYNGDLAVGGVATGLLAGSGGFGGGGAGDYLGSGGGGGGYTGGDGGSDALSLWPYYIDPVTGARFNNPEVNGYGGGAGTSFVAAGALLPGYTPENSSADGFASIVYTPPGGSGGFVKPPEPPGVPEPASWSLMILGMGCMGAALRARRRAERMTAGCTG